MNLSRYIVTVLLGMAAFLAAGLVIERLRSWFRAHAPAELPIAWVSVLVAVCGLFLSHERRWWVWTAWVAGLGGLGWWLAHRVMRSVESRVEERHEMFRRGVPPSSSEGPYVGWKDLGRTYDRAEADPCFQAFLRCIAMMTDDEWEAVLHRAKGLASLRRAKALRAVELVDPNAREAAMTSVLQALIRPGNLAVESARMGEIQVRADVARASAEAVLTHRRIEPGDFKTLYEPFEGVLPASRLLSATNAPQKRLGESHD